MSTNRRFGTLPAILGLLAPTTVAASPALAAPSSRITCSEVTLGCDLLRGESASAYFAAGVGSSGSGANLQVWIAPANPPLCAPPTSRRVIPALQPAGLEGLS